MKNCRIQLSSSAELSNAILGLEFALLTKILVRQWLPIRCFLMTSLLFSLSGRLTRYVRLIEFGDLCGLGHAFITKIRGKSSIVFLEDYQFTNDTLTALQGIQKISASGPKIL